MNIGFSFAELDERANQVARMLTGLGLGKDDRVAALLPTAHQFVAMFYGAARAGLVVVPLNWRPVAGGLAFMLRDSGAGEFDQVLRRPGFPAPSRIMVSPATTAAASKPIAHPAGDGRLHRPARC